MKPPRHPVVERYLAQLERSIAGLAPADRSEVLQEIRNHIAEATAVGTPLDAVLEALGPPDALGRAYAIELLLQPQKDRRRHPAQRWFNVVLLVALFSIPTLVAVSTLASVGISFLSSGLFVFVVGILEGLGLFPWPNLTHVPPLVAIGLGPGMVILGLLSLTALRFYVGFVVRTVRAAVPVTAPSAAALRSAT